MNSATIHEAKTHLSRLIEQVEGGDEITILRGKVAVARLVQCLMWTTKIPLIAC